MSIGLRKMEQIRKCWSRGEEIGVTPVKFKNHPTTKQLEDLIYELNDMLYFFSKRYINQYAQNYILRHLTDIGLYMKAIPEKGCTKWNARRDEALAQMRKIYKSVKSHICGSDKDSEWLMEKMAKYNLSLFLKAKENYCGVQGIPEKMRINMLKDNLKLLQIYFQDFPYRVYGNILAGMQKEILDSFTELYYIPKVEYDC